MISKINKSYLFIRVGVDKMVLGGSNILHVKNNNRQAILLQLLNESLSRVELAKRLNISSMTVTNLSNELLSEGLIEQAVEANNGRRPVGRPRQTLRLRRDAVYAVGVHIGVGYLRVGFVDLTGKVLEVRRSRFDTTVPPGALFSKIYTEIKSLEQAYPAAAAKLIGIGVGSPGLVDSERGICLTAPSLNWHRINLVEPLEERLNLPVVIENNVRAMALGEAYFGAGQGADSLAFVYGRIGIGAGFVMQRQLFRGIRAGAGEIGHTVIELNSGTPCRCGQTGCLETLITQPVLENQLARQSGEFPFLKDPLLDDEARFEKILQHGRSGHPTVHGLLMENGRFLSTALINLVNTLNPERIVLGGMFWQGADLLLPIVRRAVSERAFGGLGQHVSLSRATFGLDAGLVGAGTLALDRLFYTGGGARVMKTLNEKTIKHQKERL